MGLRFQPSSWLRIAAHGFLGPTNAFLLPGSQHLIFQRYLSQEMLAQPSLGCQTVLIWFPWARIRNSKVSPCQASLYVNVCMRIAPSPDQLVVDSLNWSDALRGVAKAGCDDVMSFVAKMAAMPGLKQSEEKSADASASQIVSQCKIWGLRWQSKAIEKQTWGHVLNIMPYCQAESILSAIGDIKNIYVEIDQLSKLGKMCLACTKFQKGTFLISEWQERKSTLTGMLFSSHWLYYGIIFADIKREQINNNMLVGARASDVGCVQVIFSIHGHKQALIS